MGDKILSRRVARLEREIIRDIAKPKHKYFKLGALSVHYDQGRTSYCTEGVWHDSIRFCPQLRILWMRKHIWVRTIKLGR